MRFARMRLASGPVQAEWNPAEQGGQSSGPAAAEVVGELPASSAITDFAQLNKKYHRTSAGRWQCLALGTWPLNCRIAYPDNLHPRPIARAFSRMAGRADSIRSRTSS